MSMNYRRRISVLDALLDSRGETEYPRNQLQYMSAAVLDWTQDPDLIKIIPPDDIFSGAHDADISLAAASYVGTAHIGLVSAQNHFLESNNQSCLLLRIRNILLWHLGEDADFMENLQNSNEAGSFLRYVGSVSILSN